MALMNLVLHLHKVLQQIINKGKIFLWNLLKNESHYFGLKIKQCQDRKLREKVQQ